jgi:hypothetical protein
MLMQADQRTDVILAACFGMRTQVIVQEQPDMVWACIVLLLTLALDGGSPRLAGTSMERPILGPNSCWR